MNNFYFSLYYPPKMTSFQTMLGDKKVRKNKTPCQRNKAIDRDRLSYDPDIRNIR